MRFKPFIALFALTGFILICCLIESCGTGEKGVERTRLEAVAPPSPNEGIVTFVSGDVTIITAGESKPAESGDKVASDSSIKTGPDSTCEITLGDAAVIGIEEDTVLLVNTLTMDKKANIGIEVALGSVLCKVKKLTETDSFNVRTDSAVCGVRGTEFLVSRVNTGETLVAVRAGKVAVLPAQADPYALASIDEAQYSKVVQVIERLETLVPTVVENHELVVKRESFGVIGAAYASLVKIVEKAAKDESIPQGELAALDKITENAAKESAIARIAQTGISEESEARLESADKLASFTRQELGLEAEAREDTKKEIRLAKINIKAEPLSAEIFINGESRGNGSVSFLAAFGKSLAVVVRMSGYMEKAVTVSPEKGGNAEYRIALEKALSDSAKTEKGDKADTGEKTTIESDKSKSDETKIEEASKSQASGETGKTMAAKAEEKTTRPEAPVIKSVLQATYGAVVGKMSIGAGKIIIADKYGIVTASDGSGKRLWSVSTDNSSNESSYPVLAWGNVYFSGSQELVIIDSGSGKLSARKKLDTSSSHIFGRRVVALGANGLLPVDSGLLVFEPQSARTLREIAIPRKSSMTPTVISQETILIVDQEGYALFVNAVTGAIETEIKTGATQPVGLDLTVMNNKAFTCGRNGVVVCIDLPSRKLVWEQNLQAERRISVSSDLEAGGGGIYAYSSGVIFGLSQANGRKLFPQITGATCPPLYTNGSLVYGTQDKKLVVANANTGRIEKTIAIDQKITAKPAADSSGLIYAGAESGAIYVIDAE